MALRNVLRSSSTSVRCLSNVSTKKPVEDYGKLRKLMKEQFEVKVGIKKNDVFAINETNLDRIKVIGFDFDYTLAEYSDDMQEFIYKRATEFLCKKHHFPAQLKNWRYFPNFFIRGLHYDIQRSLLLKIDERHYVQSDTVYRGLKKLTEEEVVTEFEGSLHINKAIMDESCFRGSRHMFQLTDIFSMPEMMLLANVVEYFRKEGLNFDPLLVFRQVEEAVRRVHVEGHLYREVAENVEKYLEKNSLAPLISHLTSCKKSLFLLTNSGFPCVDVGLRHMIAPDWRDAFDVVIVDAKKPEFFHSTNRPFRQILIDRDDSKDRVKMGWPWNGVKQFAKGKVYFEGCCKKMIDISGWKKKEIMYLGDQIYNDLQNPTFSDGWCTAAIVPEIEREIEVMNSKKFADSVIWVQTLETLISRMQKYQDAESRGTVAKWMKERRQVKKELKDVFNERFGSVFRSQLQGSYFSARLALVADIYTSSVKNLCNYQSDNIFFPLRGTLPHEQLVSFAFQYDGFDEALKKAFQL